MRVLLLVPVVAVIFQVGGRGAEGWLRHLSPGYRVGVSRITVPYGGGWGRVAGHGVAGVGAVVQGDLSVLVQLLELGSPVLEPYFYLLEMKNIKGKN